MDLLESLKESLSSVLANKLRTFLTALIIAIGIMALVGILTVIDVLTGSISTNFNLLGSNSFTIVDKGNGFRTGFRGFKAKSFSAIRYSEALEFKETFLFPAIIGISSSASGNATVKYNSLKTNPNIQVTGGDENYLSNFGYTLETGRNFTVNELIQGDNVVIIGQELQKKLFKSKDPLNETITIGDNPFRIIGVFKEKGNSPGQAGDKICLIPLLKSKEFNASSSPSYTITVQVKDPSQIKGLVLEAITWFRLIRHQKTGEENSFDITTSDELSKQLTENLGNVKWSSVGIGIITLLGASIALMNIMLVSVTERTREIGIRKSIGATPKIIQRQFLLEAFIICQIGGISGIILGILIGNIVSVLVFHAGFVVPWLWMFGGILLCAFVGISSGLYPSRKASRLDPIESLRYE